MTLKEKKDMFWILRRKSYQKSAEWGEGMDYELPQKRMNLRIVLPSANIDDFVWTWFYELLIGEKVATIFKKERVTGYSLRPVDSITVKRGSPDKIPKLQEVVVEGWAGQMPPESGTRLDTFDRQKGYTHYTPITNPAFMIDEKKWDGSDFFKVWPLPAFIFVTDRVKKIVESYKLSGCTFMKPEEFEKGDPIPSSGYAPGLPSGWFPPLVAAQRAKELSLD